MSRVARGLARLRRTGGAPAASVIAGLTDLPDPAARQLFAADGIARLVIDRTGAILRSSDLACRLIGVTPQPGSPLVDLFTPETKIAAWQSIEAVMARGTAEPGGTSVQCLRGDGSVLAVELAVTPVHEAAGQVSGAVLALADGTAQQLADRALLHSRKLQAIGALAGGIAHDFNNLLQAISGAAEALGEHRNLGPDAAEDIAQILGGARRGGALVAQLLAFARQQQLQPQIVAVNPAITDVAALLRRTLGQAIKLELALAEPGRLVWIDPGQLDQVLVNLAVNARDAMQAGGVLTLRSSHRTVLATTTGGLEPVPPGRYVTIEVTDTGGGIAPDVLARIFEPFFTTRGQGGTGLGLATVLGIVRQSGGFLEVDTVVGAGTTMRLLLPRAVAPASPPAIPRRAAPVVPTGRRILLVDDEAPIRRLAARALAQQGWQVLAAESGEEALALLGPQSPLAGVVSDMMMPGMDGAAVVQAVRARLGQPNLPALIVSGYAEAGMRAAIGGSATAYLAKPYRMRELADRVAALFGAPQAGGSAMIDGS